jgi:gluconolactonase
MSNMSAPLEVRDPRLLAIIDPAAALVRHLTGFKFTEGPVWHPVEQHLRFSDITGNSIFQWSAAEGLKDIRPNSHMANGNTYDRQGRMLTCHHASSRVTRTEPDGSITVLASHYQGKELNSPNDIVVRSDGAIYFTDPRPGREARVGIPREPELPFAGVYRLDPNEVAEDGSLRNGRVWAETQGEGAGVPDGMKFDSAGNLFCCGPGGVHVFAPDATCLGVILVPEQATNFIWGDADFQTLYITAVTSVYRIRVRIPGNPLF